MIDLHIHSNASDGTWSPAEILSEAQRLRLQAIAITDHDTIHGSREAINSGIPSSLKFLSGIEISAAPPREFPCSGSFHILGYKIRVDDPELNHSLEILQDARKNRNPRIIERLNAMGIPITLEDIRRTGDRQIGRPHIARFLVERKFAANINEAFDKYLGKDKPAYVDKYRIDSRHAIEMILNAGGIPVLAHPLLLKPVTDAPVEQLFGILKEMGLMGIEVYYPAHSEKDIANYSQIAERLGLLKTGGTDFHGDITPTIRMGSGYGSLNIPFHVYQTLIRHERI